MHCDVTADLRSFNVPHAMPWLEIAQNRVKYFQFVHIQFSNGFSLHFCSGMD